MFASDGGECLVAQSYSKIMGLYAERIGALSMVRQKFHDCLDHAPLFAVSIYVCLVSGMQDVRCSKPSREPAEAFDKTYVLKSTYSWRSNCLAHLEQQVDSISVVTYSLH